MKHITITTLAAMLLGTTGAFAVESAAYTKPSGFVTITIAPAPAEGQSKLTAFSVALRNSALEFGDSTSIAATTLTKTGAGWTVDEWKSEPHILYITNDAGAEEGFLITGNTTDTLTVATPIDLTLRYGTGVRAYSIGKAHTFGNLFGTTSVDFRSGNFSTADLLYIWDGSNWITYYHSGSAWKKTGSLSTSNDDVIFPDEGLFVLRRGTEALNLVLTGSVPTKPQVSTIPGNQLTMVATRYPVGTTVSQLGFQNLPGWSDGSISSGDRFYLWNGDNWLVYYRSGGNWKRSGSLSVVNDEVIPNNVLLFVQRESSSTDTNSGNTHIMPYNLDN